LAGFFAAKTYDRYKVDNTLFLIVGIQDKHQVNSSYENLEAAEQIAESMQGWFKDPAFLDDLQAKSGYSYAVKAKTQEKNNIIVNFSAADTASSNIYQKELLSLLMQKISSYNQSSDLQINLASSAFNIATRAESLPLFLFLAAVIGLFFGITLCYLYEHWAGKLQSSGELSGIIRVKSVFEFNNPANFRHGFHFLLKHLNQNYKNEHLQILDLTDKKGTVLEVLSRHGSFREIKSYALPEELDKVNPELPAVIVAELGQTSTKDLCGLSLLDFTKAEAIIFERC